MNKKSTTLSVLVLVVLALLIGMVIGYAMHNEPDASVEASVSMPAVERTLFVLAVHYERFASIHVVERCNNVLAAQPIGHHPTHGSMQTNVRTNTVEERSDNATTTVTPITTNVPASTPVPESKCNNGLGNGPDCPPPGHDKDNDGQADDAKGDNDDDNQNRPCGDKGNPCNKDPKGLLTVLPLFSTMLIGNPLLDHIMRYVSEYYEKPILLDKVKIDQNIMHVQIAHIMNESHNMYHAKVQRCADGDSVLE